MYRIHQIKLNIGETLDHIPEKIAKKTGRKNLTITSYNIVRESIDARHKDDIKKVYTVDFECKEKLKLDLAPDMTYHSVTEGTAPKYRPIIVGFGPCGMFCGLILAAAGYKPIIIERGACIDQRVLDVEEFWKKGILKEDSNVQFGEGGAGTFSDGKLTTGIKDPRIRKVLEEFVEAGADQDIMYIQKPHIGTDVLRKVVKNIREKIISLGGEVRFDTKLIEIDMKDGYIQGALFQSKGENYTLQTNDLVIAIGHSSRDTFRYLFETGISMEQKPFSIGVRIEHPQSIIDKAQYGNTKGLPPADYKLSHRCENGRGVYTFCMCPGGQVVVASSQKGGVVTNGMSNRGRDSGTANSALLVDVKVSDFDSEHPLAGIEFQEKYERLAFKMGGSDYTAPKTTWKEFNEGGEAAEKVIQSLPPFAVEAMREAMPFFGRKLHGFDSKDSILTAVESRSSSPVRFERNQNLQSNIVGIYPGGEGTGHAGGIMSAACDGIKIAEAIIKK